MRSFQAPGKWILAGEHAVLRGCPALVFPLKSLGMKLEFHETTEPLKVEFAGEHGGECQLLFWGVLENATARLGHRLSELQGRMRLSSNLPIGAGLGASAALCVVVARWCESQGWLKAEQLYDFARSLEDLFHGESSGVDVAVALSGEALRFERGGERRLLSTAWQPKWYLSYSGQRGVTAECVRQVKALAERDPQLFRRLDEQMQEAVALAEQALQMPERDGEPVLVRAMELAADCFEKWGLIHGDLEVSLKALKSAGAKAVKPTGSGGGGYILSLWAESPVSSPTPLQSVY